MVGSRVLLALALLAGAATAAAQPRNDRCVDRTSVTFLPYSDVQPIGAATLEPREQLPACGPAGFAHSVWYAMAPPVDGVYAFSTCGSDFDTALQVYDGAFCDRLERQDLECSDDGDLCGPGARQSLVVIRRSRGPETVAHVQVGSAGPASGTLHLAMRLVPTARNDACEAARVIDHPVFRELLDVAAVGGGEPADRTFLSSCGAVGDVDLGAAPHSVWYRYTPARSGAVTIDTRGTTTPVAVAVFRGGVLGCNHLGARTACAANRPAAFTAVAGQPYLIYVAVPTLIDPDVLVLRLTGPDLRPRASAGPLLTVAPGAPVVLDASASSDPDGDPITYAWTQLHGPRVTLSDPASVLAGFTAPQVVDDTVLDFRVVVSDGALLSRAVTRILVSRTTADADMDGVPLPTDRCPNTPAGEPVDADGCACSDRGHASCPAAGRCAPGRCAPATGACIADPAPAGTPCRDDGDACTQDVCDGAGTCTHAPVDCARDCRTQSCEPGTGTCAGPALAPGTRCADDGDPCTDDVCDATGTCTHERAGAFTGAACRLDDLAGRLAGGDLPKRDGERLARLLARARIAIATAEAAATVGDFARCRRRLAGAARRLARFAHAVARLEARRALDSLDAGMLLAAARATSAAVVTLKASLPHGEGRRSRR